METPMKIMMNVAVPGIFKDSRDTTLRNQNLKSTEKR